MKHPPADIAAQLRQMGRDDRARGVSIADPNVWPFAPKSHAAALWLEGWREGWRQIGLFE